MPNLVFRKKRIWVGRFDLARRRIHRLFMQLSEQLLVQSSLNPTELLRDCLFYSVAYLHPRCYKCLLRHLIPFYYALAQALKCLRFN